MTNSFWHNYSPKEIINSILNGSFAYREWLILAGIKIESSLLNSCSTPSIVIKALQSRITTNASPVDVWVLSPSSLSKANKV